LQNPRFELFLKKSPVLTAEQKRRNEESREAENKEYTATFNQHSLPIFIASPILSTHNDGLNRGNVRNTNLAPMTREFYPIMEQARLGRQNVPCRENLAKRKAALSNAVKR
jgi:hypothetical protein